MITLTNEERERYRQQLLAKGGEIAQKLAQVLGGLDVRLEEIDAVRGLGKPGMRPEEKLRAYLDFVNDKRKALETGDPAFSFEGITHIVGPLPDAYVKASSGSPGAPPPIRVNASSPAPAVAANTMARPVGGRRLVSVEVVGGGASAVTTMEQGGQPVQLNDELRARYRQQLLAKGGEIAQKLAQVLGGLDVRLEEIDAVRGLGRPGMRPEEKLRAYLDFVNDKRKALEANDGTFTLEGITHIVSPLP